MHEVVWLILTRGVRFILGKLCVVKHNLVHDQFFFLIICLMRHFSFTIFAHYSHSSFAVLLSIT